MLSSYWDLGLPHCLSLLIPRGSIASLETQFHYASQALVLKSQFSRCNFQSSLSHETLSDFSSSLMFVIGHIAYHTGLGCTLIPCAPGKHTCLTARSLASPWIFFFFWFLNLSFKAYHTARIKQRKCPLTQRSNMYVDALLSTVTNSFYQKHSHFVDKTNKQPEHRECCLWKSLLWNIWP